MKTVLNIHDMHCASCANTIAERLQALTGVKSARVNYAAAQAEVEHGAKISTDDLISAVRDAGYDASVPGAPAESVPRPKGRKRLVFATILTVPLLVLSMGPMLGLPFTKNAYTGLVELVLVIMILSAGAAVYRRGFGGLFRTKKANMDTLIALGTVIAFVYSAWQLVVWSQTGVYDPSQVYFESAGMIMTFILLGRYLEDRAKTRTKGAIHELLSLAPETARVVRDNQTFEVPVEEVVVGAILKIKPGDRIPVDGVITVGNSRVDESLLTGESAAVKKGIRDEVYAGTINKTGMFMMRATKVGRDTAYHRVVSLVEEAQRSTAPVQRTADRVASVFVPAVLLLSFLTFLAWLVFSTQGVGFAVRAAVSVLIIACPCALGLATPTAIMVSSGVGARKGLLFRNAAAIQKLSEVRGVAFDKTGTLTVGRPEVVSVRTYYDIGEGSVLRYAASVESGSEHPLAEAIVRYAEKKQVDFGDPRTFESFDGRGVKGKVEGRKIVVGSVKFFQDEGIGIYDVRERVPELAKDGLTPVLVAIEGKLAALIGIRDPLREHAREAVESLNALGLSTAMLSGDQSLVAERVARELGIGVVRAELSPEEKLSELRKLGKKRLLAMVGDGINDAPALAAAHAGIAMGGGASVAVEAGDVVLLRDDPRLVATAYGLSRDTMRVVKQNLWWAFGYNVVAIPVAAGVLFGVTGWLLSPAIAAGAMAFSSLSVVLNSLRLRHA